MDKKVTGILAYFSIIGWLIAYLAGDKEGAKVHLNQGLVLGILSLILSCLTRIPFLGWIFWILTFVPFVFAIWGIIKAATDDDKPLPVIGDIKILK